MQPGPGFRRQQLFLGLLTRIRGLYFSTWIVLEPHCQYFSTPSAWFHVKHGSSVRYRASTSKLVDARFCTCSTGTFEPRRSSGQTDELT